MKRRSRKSKEEYEDVGKFILAIFALFLAFELLKFVYFFIVENWLISSVTAVTLVAAAIFYARRKKARQASQPLPIPIFDNQNTPEPLRFDTEYTSVSANAWGAVSGYDEEEIDSESDAQTEELWSRKIALYEKQRADVIHCGRIPTQPILNREEAKVFYGALEALQAMGMRTRNWHVHAQVSMGEIYAPKCVNCRGQWRCDECWRAFKALNSKRHDLVICNNKGQPRLVIEHQGEGHIDARTEKTEKESILRNEVKEIAVKASDLGELGFLETPPECTIAMAKALILERLEAIIAMRAAAAEQQAS